MILEIVIVCLVSVPSIIYAFRKIRKAKVGCCSCEQDVQEDNVNQQQNNSESNQTLLRYIMNKFTPRKTTSVAVQPTDMATMV